MKVVIDDPSGAWTLTGSAWNNFSNPTLLAYTDSYITLSGTNGSVMEIQGNFSSSSYYNWTISSMAIYQNGTTKVSISEMNISYYQLDYLGGSSSLSGSDTITSNVQTGTYWATYGGNDVLTLGTGDDTVDGGSGTDRLVINDTFGNATASSSYSALVLNSADGQDRISGVEILEFANRTLALTVGSSSSNSLQGDSTAGISHDLILGGIGNDTLRGLSGNDVLKGEDGSDSLDGGSGLDQLDGGTGADTLTGGGDNDFLSGQSGDDQLDGGQGRDRLLGGTGKDHLKGGNGNDTLSGGGGNDTLSGGTGGDKLSGGNGRDVLLGHKGNDQLTGGGRADTFVFHKGHGNDTITDFTAGQDHIQIGRGASRLGQLDFEQQGDDVLVSFADVTILVEDISAAQLQDADNFLF
ncbi:calcium-binding protein [Leisingera caerulea]|uniref:calcium-binding protein n=1 Tax=Leisingera caerulea TaxID=506591 RepID=UPI0003F6E82E|nr:calcium-binding protein [Leisingera caerulea]